MPDHRREFLRSLQERIDRYKPLLEDEFAVCLGAVVAKPLLVGEWLACVYEKSDQVLHEQALRRRGHPPARLRLFLHSLEKGILWVPAFAFIYVRFWMPEFIMKWQGSPPAVLVSFAGWVATDYEKNLRKLDQWVVHELAHGIWAEIAQDRYGEHDRRWRLWNEGFAHYVADIHMRNAYPPDSTVDVAWSGFRQHGKQFVGETVNRCGPEVLKVLPKRWREFDGQIGVPRK